MRPRIWHWILPASLALGCIDEPEPRELTLKLLSPNADAGAVMFMVRSAAPNEILAVTPSCEGCKVFSYPVSEVEFHVIVTGPLKPGPVARLVVSGAGPLGAYRVDVREVAGRDFQLRKATEYGLVLER